MTRKISASRQSVVQQQDHEGPEGIIACLKYVQNDVRTLSPMGAHLLAMAIKQLIEDTNSSESLEDQDLD